MIKVVGIGAGGDTLTLRAVREIRKAEVIIGYRGYIRQIENFIGPNTKVIETDVDQIELRIRQALSMKERNTVIISSGDPMVFGMGSRLADRADEIIPGITAISLAASILKVPLDNFAVINASTYSSPLPEILSRLNSAINGKFNIGIYNLNPVKRRADALTIEKIVKESANGWTFYIISNAMKSNQSVISGKVQDLDITIVNMNSLLMLRPVVK
ncbi:MAG: SAM-dependent methyltransferase [Metallosphaera sp.]|uniref:Uroporphyrin-III C/tetrapyrrole methyltransferase n=1 Tax=Metallosphaera cuprina (strain Ar-4) TaxID=1006006 RepID=F4FYR7_METCR|nr:SAM-dependent methyltransferase [Metallosphaera cuprina]AEB94306.1 uroporphyrin-III C/tetrapyrrole methyltransferase [Metallosphaera cuprina Ar-4]